MHSTYYLLVALAALCNLAASVGIGGFSDTGWYATSLEPQTPFLNASQKLTPSFSSKTSSKIPVPPSLTPGCNNVGSDVNSVLVTWALQNGKMCDSDTSCTSADWMKFNDAHSSVRFYNGYDCKGPPTFGQHQTAADTPNTHQGQTTWCASKDQWDLHTQNGVGISVFLGDANAVPNIPTGVPSSSVVPSSSAVAPSPKPSTKASLSLNPIVCPTTKLTPHTPAADVDVDMYWNTCCEGSSTHLTAHSTSLTTSDIPTPSGVTRVSLNINALPGDCLLNFYNSINGWGYSPGTTYSPGKGESGSCVVGFLPFSHFYTRKS